MNYYASAPAPKKDNQKMFYILLTFALLGSWGYIFYDQAQSKKMQADLQTKIAKIDSAKTELQKEYDAAIIRLDELTTMNSSLDSLVKTKNTELDNMKSRIGKLLNKQNRSEADLAEAKKLIEQLNGQITGYVAEIERLKGENQQLQTDKQELITQKTALQQEYDKTKKEKEETEDKLDKASTLFASNIAIAALDVRKSGKEVEKTKAKKVDKLKLTFDVYSRAGAEAVKDLYVIIKDPSDKTVLLETMGTTTFSTRNEGEKEFSKKVAVNFKPDKFSPVMLEWKPTTRLAGGTYKVFIYNNGFKIGDDTIVLK
jgi:DNA repair exonuclease SbcCD ATPase subunit